MKQKISLASSTSILIGAVIAILALLRGPVQTILLLLTFALWGLWVLLALLRPSWQSNRDYRYYNYNLDEPFLPQYSSNMTALARFLRDRLEVG